MTPAKLDSIHECDVIVYFVEAINDELAPVNNTPLKNNIEIPLIENINL
jgi:hypothetical protein